VSSRRDKPKAIYLWKKHLVSSAEAIFGGKQQWAGDAKEMKLGSVSLEDI